MGTDLTVGSVVGSGDEWVEKVGSAGSVLVIAEL